MPRFSPAKLNQLFLDGLGDSVTFVENAGVKPLIVDVKLGASLVKLRVYLFNCTNPPGGRKSDEYKSQVILPGQQRGERCTFFKDDGRIALLGAVAPLTDTGDTCVFVFWDAMFHENCAYSANVQVKSEVLIGALREDVSIGAKGNGEKIVACLPENLAKGVRERIFTV